MTSEWCVALREARIWGDESQGEAAAAIGASVSTYGAWERGERAPDSGPHYSAAYNYVDDRCGWYTSENSQASADE